MARTSPLATLVPSALRNEENDADGFDLQFEGPIQLKREKETTSNSVVGLD
jgi:hypothetical protein